MKMKKIAAALLALTLLSGCSGNMVTEETVTTTAEITVTEDVTIISTEDTEAVEIIAAVTEAEETSKPRATPPGSMFEAREDDLTKPSELTTIEEITAESIESNAVVDEVVEHIELNRTNHLSKYTELYGAAILLITKNKIIKERFEIAHPNSTFGGIAADLDVLGFFERPVDYPSDPNTSFVKGWGCNSSHIFNTITNYEDGVYRNLLIDLTNSSPETLYEYIDNDTPVVVWVTEGLAEPVLFAEYEGNKMYNPKECVILAGYSDTAVCVWSVIEEKYVTYDRVLFEQRYAEMGSMALTVVKE